MYLSFERFSLIKNFKTFNDKWQFTTFWIYSLFLLNTQKKYSVLSIQKKYSLFNNNLHFPLLFNLKIVYSYVVEIADSESNHGLHGEALVSKILTYYNLQKYV